MAPRVCILARENVFHWAPLYVEAFRECCEVITMGPGLDVPALESFGRGHGAALLTPNDIVTETDDVFEALALLPSGWRPDCLVGIQSSARPYHNIPEVGCPTAYISVDTWHDPGELQVARHYDYVFAAQRALVPYLRDGGCRHTHWLPLACAPAHHCPAPVDEDYDVAFVGTTHFKVNEQRIQRLNRLAEHFKLNMRSGAGYEAMRRIVCSGKLAFNSSISQDVNMRVFELMAMGRPMLMNRDARVNGLFDLFEEDHHFIGYDDHDLLDQARRYLADAEARQRMGEAARAEVLAKHTYRHRVVSLLETVLGTSPHPIEAPLRRAGDRVGNYLPHGTRHLVDVGTAMGQSRVALRRQGIACVTGVAPDAQEADRRAASYDAMHHWPITPREVGPTDAVVWTLGDAIGDNLEKVTTWAFGALETGGTLVLRYRPREWNDTGLSFRRNEWDVWLYDRGFHLMIFRPPLPEEHWCHITARKYTRHVREMSKEMYDRFPGGHLGGE